MERRGTSDRSSGRHGKFVCNDYVGVYVYTYVIPPIASDPRPLLALTLILALTGCSAASSDTATPLPEACRARPYWPTEGWQSSQAGKFGLPEAPMAALDRFVADSMPNMSSLLVVHGGYVAAERYWHGADSSTPFDIRSSTKSVTSAIVGEAIAQGYIRGLDERVYDFFPEYFHDLDPASWKWRIRVKHLLTMTSGLAWDERVGIQPPPGVPETTWLTPDMVARPGTRFNYSSGNTHMLSIAVTRASKESLRAFGNATIFRTLGMEIGDARWPTDPRGYNWGGTGLQLTAREMAKFGYLYLNDGCWEGEQVIDQEWVRESTLPRLNSYLGKNTYGYLWWTTDFGPHHAFYADGYGGQMIIVVPDLDAVIVTTALPDPTTRTVEPMVLVRRYVIPAITAAASN